VRHFWKELGEAGFINKALIAAIYQNGWQREDEERIEHNLRAKRIYISNFVKCAQPNPINPSRQVMRETLPLLSEELALVNPEYVITFGLLPLNILTNADVRLRDILASVRNKTYEPIESIPLNRKAYKVLPCYFPLGHGNPPRAKEILRYIQATF